MGFKLRYLPLIIIGGIILLPVLFWTFFHLSFFLLPNPPAPVNKYGEFPFRLVYEIRGEQIIVEDALICEFVGREIDAARGKWLKWDERLASDNTLTRFFGMYRLLDIGTEWQYAGVIELLDGSEMGKGSADTIYLDIGNSLYYLGYNVLDGYSPGIVLNATEIIEEDVLWEEHGIRIIEASFSQPMVGNGIAIKK